MLLPVKVVVFKVVIYAFVPVKFVVDILELVKLFESPDMLFDNVDNAIDIWNLTTITRTTDNKRFSFVSVLHDGSTQPAVGSLLIYRSTPTMKTGHVAVVTRIERDLIHFDERNGNHFDKSVRILPNGMLDDPELIGWKTIMS